MTPPLLLCVPQYASLGAELCRLGPFEAGSVTTNVFPDGERYTRIDSDVDGRDVLLLGGTTHDEQTMAIFDLASAAVEWGARRLTLLAPYFGYSTMERAIQSGEAVTARYRAQLLSAIPVAPGGNRIFMVDLHVPGLPYYFNNNIRAVHVYAKAVIAKACRDQGGDDFVLACTDAGRAKWVESLANDLGVNASFVFKRRLDGARTKITAVSAQVEGKHVVIYDDMIRTGGSLLAAAQAYHDAGARTVSAVTTHGVFPQQSIARLRDSGLLTQVASTDSHPRAGLSQAMAPDFLQVYSLAPVLAEALTAHP